jgi:hypothetical protein
MQTRIWIPVAKWSDDTAGKAEGRAWERELDRLERPAGTLLGRLLLASSYWRKYLSRMRTTTQFFTPVTLNLMRYTLVLAVM